VSSSMLGRSELFKRNTCSLTMGGGDDNRGSCEPHLFGCPCR
jgi:hypothetical protein